MVKVNYTSEFEKSLQKMTPATINALEAKLKLFCQNPFLPQLKTHKLKGKLAQYWAFSVTRKIRILFVFENKKETTFINIGPHEIYR